MRSLYFLLAGVVHRFVYLKPGLALILTFIGAKMLLVDVFHFPDGGVARCGRNHPGGAIGLSLAVGKQDARPAV